MASRGARKKTPDKMKTALVMVGGGARACYQAGVLAGVNDLLRRSGDDEPIFNIINGVSAGAINGAFLAARAHKMSRGFSELYGVWERLRFEDVFRINALSFADIGIRWMKDLAFGGVLPKSRKTTNHLIDTTPLHKTLYKEVDFNQIHQNIRKRKLLSFSVAATNYGTGTEITFFDSPAEVDTWARSSRLGIRTRIQMQHVLASASIPILFKPVEIGGFHFGDGSIRQGAPLSPAVHLGADRILAISVRHRRSIDFTRRLNRKMPVQEISLADICGVLLNAAFFDGLDIDSERMQRTNESLDYYTITGNKPPPFRARKIPLLLLRPSRDLGEMARQHFQSFPWTLRYLMKGIGASNERGADFLSYLAFEQSYASQVLELGYQDAFAQRERILEFFNAPGVEETEHEGRILQDISGNALSLN